MQSRGSNQACFEDFLIVLTRLLFKLPAPCKGGGSVIAVTLAKLVKIIVSTCMLMFLQQKTAVWACSVIMQHVVDFLYILQKQQKTAVWECCSFFLYSAKTYHTMNLYFQADLPCVPQQAGQT